MTPNVGLLLEGVMPEGEIKPDRSPSDRRPRGAGSAPRGLVIQRGAAGQPKFGWRTTFVQPVSRWSKCS
ncbi:hypothetical protein GCM10023191_066570 [Actinoallomurus oryzae]|uniref:Uncharacterized protein n=1 Tax=Actinoallomurus oryzae TaxID=502180 RepID=A0ABP8QPR7_9ACTN